MVEAEVFLYMRAEADFCKGCAHMNLRQGEHGRRTPVCLPYVGFSDCFPCSARFCELPCRHGDAASRLIGIAGATTSFCLAVTSYATGSK